MKVNWNSRGQGVQTNKPSVEGGPVFWIFSEKFIGDKVQKLK